MRSLALLSLTLLLFPVGCTTWSGRKDGEVQCKKLMFEANNFNVTKTKIQATASCSYVFPSRLLGILTSFRVNRIRSALMNESDSVSGIAIQDPHLYAKAYEDLRKQADLVGKSAQITNVTVESVLVNYFVIGEAKLTLTADVVEFTGEYKDYATR